MNLEKHHDWAGSVPQLITEGVSEYLTDYKRPGYTEDALRQFVVLDDIESQNKSRKRKHEPGQTDQKNDRAVKDGSDEDDDEIDDDEDSFSEGSENDGSDNSDVPLDEVDMMLDEGLPEDYKVKREVGKFNKKTRDGNYYNRRLQVIDEIFTNPFDVLPEGWVRVTHNTGIPIFLHKDSRVCSTTMPYFLGPGSARKHRVPLSAIPCLQYRKAIEREKIEQEQKAGDLKVGKCPFKNEQISEEPQEADIKNESEPPSKKTKTDDGDDHEQEQLEDPISEPKISTKVDDDVANTVVEWDEEILREGELDADIQREVDLEAEAEREADRQLEAQNNGPSLRDRLKESLGESDVPDPSAAVALPKARIETAQENQETHSVNHLELREYCQKLFRYRTIDVMRFKTWSERRRFSKMKKKEKQLQRPSLPEGTKLISFPIMEPGVDDNGVARMKKEWIMNPSGKSYVCILHECVQHALKTQPVYEFKDLENPATPYSATVSINKMKYGTGVGTSKRQAKSEAAKATLEVLIPEMRDKIEEDVHRSGAGLSKNSTTDLSFFDDIKIQDPRVHEFCAKTTEPSPYTILLTCLKRNFGLGDIDINCEVKMLRHQKNEFTMSVGSHTATVICKNKREGKQRASQAILQAMHPHIQSWGSLLRLYGNRSVKTLREKKQEEQEITTLQSRASANSPNWAILDKLKEAMLKLKERNASVKPLGAFIPPGNVELPLASSSNLNNLEL